MMIRRFALVFFSFLFIASAIAPAFALGHVAFTVDLRDTKSGTVHVTLVPTGYQARTAMYQMPIWAPGAYSVTGYGRYVEHFTVFDKNGNPLTAISLSENRWKIATAKPVARIEYDVKDSHADTTSLYFAMANIDTTVFFANATALFGYFDDDKSATAQVTYLLPSGWKLACPLDPKKGYVPNTFSNTVFIAKNYDVLADAPILAAPDSDGGNHSFRIVTSGFREGTADYDIAVVTDGGFSSAKMDSLAEYLQKIVRAETDFFHDTPYKHYTFEIVAPTLSHIPSFAQGALEHANASDYLIVDFGWDLFKQAYLSIFSHEFFHLWNVKRIHSTLLGPFDYTQRVMTKSLWMAEGITEYYAHTLLARYGIISPARFYGDVESWRKEMEMAPVAATYKSLEDLSIDESAFDLDEAELFYSRGPLVAMMLDIEIRSQTHNKKSLDDVMRALNNDAKHGKTIREEDIIKKVEQYSGCDLADFYHRYIHGTDTLPLDSYFAKMGISSSQKSDNQTQFAMIQDSIFMLQSLAPDGPLAQCGLQKGDVLSAVNGTKITPANIEVLSLLDSLEGGTLTIVRNGKSIDLPIQFSSPKPASPSNIDPTAPPLAAEIRKGIVGE